MPYVGKSPSAVGVRSRYYFTASGGETSLSGSDNNGKTLVFTDAAYVDVILNGNNLVSGTDYVAVPNTNTISGLAALVANDVVEIISYDVFSVSDTVPASTGGTFSGSLTVSGNIAVTGTVDSRDVAADGTKLDGIEAAADVTDATNVAAAGAAMLTGANFTGNVDVTGTATVDQLTVDSVGAFGSFDSKSTISTESAFAGSDKDFRVKTTGGNVNHFVVQATTGNVGIGTSSPDYNLVVKGSANINANILAVKDSDNIKMMSVEQTSNGDGRLFVYDTAGNADILLHSNGNSYFNGGNVGIGTSSPQGIVHIDQGASDDAHLILETHSAGDSKMVFSQGQTAGNWAVGYDDGGGVTENSFCFAYKSDGYPSLSGQNKMLLTPAGNLGIGTTSPIAQSKLTVAGNSLSITGSDANFGAGGVRGMLDLAGGYLRMGAVNGGGSASGVKLLAPAGQEAVIVDTAARVGINGIPVNTGASLPIVDLHGGQGDNGILIRTGDNNVSSGGGSVMQFGFNTSTGYRHAIKTRHDSAINVNNAIEFYTWQTSQNSADLGNLKVLSAGAVGVTMPNQPSFYAFGAAAYQAQSGGFAYNSTSFNIGGHYNTSTYRFTAPVAGVYYFSAAAIMQSSAADGGLVLVVNGTFNFAKDYTSGPSRSSNVSSVIYLNANDYVFVNNEGNNTWYLRDGYGFFSGRLIG